MADMETIELAGDAGVESGPPLGDTPDAKGRSPDGCASARSDTPAPAPPAVEEDADSRRARREITLRIRRYTKIFPEETAELSRELAEMAAGQMPLDRLESLLDDAQFCVETRRSSAQARGMFLGGLSAVEAAGPLAGLRLRGLTATAAQSEELLKSADEVALKYQAISRLDPAARLAMSVAQLALAVDAANRRAAQVQQTPVGQALQPGAGVSPPTKPAATAVTSPAPAENVGLCPTTRGGGGSPTNINAAAEFADL